MKSQLARVKETLAGLNVRIPRNPPYCQFPPRVITRVRDRAKIVELLKREGFRIAPMVERKCIDILPAQPCA